MGPETLNPESIETRTLESMLLRVGDDGQKDTQRRGPSL